MFPTRVDLPEGALADQLVEAVSFVDKIILKCHCAVLCVLDRARFWLRMFILSGGIEFVDCVRFSLV